MVYKFTIAEVPSLYNVNCSKMTIIYELKNSVRPMCNLLGQKEISRNRFLFVFNRNATFQPTHGVISTLRNICLMELILFDISELFTVQEHLVKFIDTIIFDSATYESYKMNLSIYPSIQLFNGRVFTVGVSSNRTNDQTSIFKNEKLIMKLNDKLSLDINICEIAPITSSLAIEAWKFEPFTISDNGFIFNRGIEIMMIESIVKKLNVEHHYVPANSSPYNR